MRHDTEHALKEILSHPSIKNVVKENFRPLNKDEISRYAYDLTDGTDESPDWYKKRLEKHNERFPEGLRIEYANYYGHRI